MENAKREAKKLKGKEKSEKSKACKVRANVILLPPAPSPLILGQIVYSAESRAHMLKFIEAMWPVRGQLEKFRTLACVPPLSACRPGAAALVT